MTQVTNSVAVSRQTEAARDWGGSQVGSVAYVLKVMFIALFAALSVAGAQAGLTFEKSSVREGAWVGTIAGDMTGTLVTTLIAADQSQPVWQVEMYWIVMADRPGRSFVARLTGTLDTVSGVVKMAGSVVDGYLKGASVRETGQLQDAQTSTFVGTIVIDQEASRPLNGGSMTYVAAIRLDR